MFLDKFGVKDSVDLFHGPLVLFFYWHVSQDKNWLVKFARLDLILALGLDNDR